MRFRPARRVRKRAGARSTARTQRLVEAIDRLLAFVAPDRRGGTEDTIRRARRRGVVLEFR